MGSGSLGQSEAGVRERDLQESLAKLLRSSWIGSRIASALLTSHTPVIKPEAISDIRCDVAVWDSTLGITTASDRETDLVVRFDFHENDSRKTGLLLIEVKIVAPFGRGQVDDYCRRVELLRGQADLVLAALVAPQTHLLKPGASRFKGWLTLEQLHSLAAEHRQFAAESQRLDYEAEVIARSIAAAAAGYQPLVSLDRQEQFAYYDTFVSEYTPQLSVRPSSAGAKSLDRFFDTPLTVGTIKHRVEEGLVVIEFLGKRSPPDAVRSAAYPDRLRVEPSGSTSCCIHRGNMLRGLDMSRSFDSQVDVLRESLDEVAWLYAWVERNRSAFRGWAD